MYKTKLHTFTLFWLRAQRGKESEVEESYNLVEGLMLKKASALFKTFLILTQGYFLLQVSEREGRRGGGRDRDLHVKGKHRLLPRARLHWGLNPQTPGAQDDTPTHRATARASAPFFNAKLNSMIYLENKQ